MRIPPTKSIQQFLLHQRGWITFVIVTLVVWSIGSGWHKGEPAVFSLRAMSVGDVIRADDVSLGYIDGAVTTYIRSVDEIVGKQLTQSVAAGSALTSAAITATRSPSNRVVLTLPLEDSDPGNYAAGTHVHLWSLGDEFNLLVSSDATVVASGSESLGSNFVTVSIPRADESAVMQSSAVRIAAVG